MFFWRFGVGGYTAGRHNFSCRKVRDPKLHGRCWGLCPFTKLSRNMSVQRLTSLTRNAGSHTPAISSVPARLEVVLSTYGAVGRRLQRVTRDDHGGSNVAKKRWQISRERLASSSSVSGRRRTDLPSPILSRPLRGRMTKPEKEEKAEVP